MNGTPEAPHIGHRERMRRRFLEDRDLSGFAQHEILEMLLYCCYPRTDTNALAHRLIEHFGSIDAVLSAEPEELTATGLIGDKPAATLSFICSLSAYLRRGGSEPIEAFNWGEVREYVAGWYSGETREIIKLFPVSDNMRIIRCIPLMQGGTAAARVTVRDVAEKLMPLGSKALFIAHNHPFAEARPSQSDITATKQLSDGLLDAGIMLIDHFVVGSDGICSFRELGLIHD